MNTVIIESHNPLRSYLLEAKYEFLKLWRTPSFVLPTLIFPPFFYLLFGVLLSAGRGGDTARYLLATYGVFGIMGPALFGFGVNVALERERGFLTFKRALPMPPGALLAAKTAMAMLFAAIISIVLAVIAMTMAKVSLAPAQWVLLFVINVLGVLPFCALGLWIGSTVGGEAAPAVINLMYLPMAFLSGLWLPLSILPSFLGTLAPVWPSYHLAQIALKVVDRDAGSPIALHLVVLMVITVACFVLARRRLVSA